MTSPRINRNLRKYGSACLNILIAGLLSRSAIVPAGFLREYAGDTLWAMMVYAVAALMLRHTRAVLLLIFTLLFSFIIEISQLYHAPWIDAIRATHVGGLALGYGFLWSDWVCYTVGAFLAFFFDTTHIKNSNRKVRQVGAEDAKPRSTPPD